MPPDSPTPEEEAHLRRLLTDARATEPMPEEVARRLDATLAELGREGSAETGADVVPLARRRRGVVVGALAAAAVVIVAGVGVTEVIRAPDGGDAASSAGLATDGAESGATTEDGDAQIGGAVSGGAPDAASGEAATERPDLPVALRETKGPLPRVGEQPLERDALRVRRGLPDRARGVDGTAVLHAPAGFTCRPESWGAGVFAGVRYADQNAVLAYREPSEQNQVVEVLQCGTGTLLRSVTLPAP